MADNWYIVLELDFDPPVEDEQKIAAKIEERQRYWSTNFNHFKLGPQYRTWHQKIPQIKKDMIGPANIRKKLAEEACALTYGPVDKLVKTIGRKGHITQEECQKISEKMKVTVEVVRKRAAKLSIKIEDTKPVDYQSTYDKYYKTKPQGATKFDGTKQDLAAMHADNLYDFLFDGTTTKNAASLPYDKLLQRSAERKTKDFNRSDATSGIGQRLCANCDETFKNEESKKIYDAYLEYMRRKEVLDRAKVVGEISGELADEQAEEIIGQLTQLFKDRKLAEEVLTAFCQVEKIRYSRNAPPPREVKICRCGCINDVSDGRKVCSSCGLDLQIKCPSCGTLNDSNVRVCKCRFNFDNIDRALALFEQAGHAVDVLDFVAARALLTDAGRYWPGSPKSKPLSDRIAEVEGRVGKEVSKMRTAIGAKKYCEAKAQYMSIKRLFPAYSDAAIEEEFTQAISKAQALFARAKAARVDAEILELCAQAYDLCADLPGVRELMPAPAAVSGMSISVNVHTKANTVNWNVTNDRSIRYVVVRSSTGWIQHISDGETVFRGSANSYTDRDITPGVTYYYNVFAERAGVYSQGTKGVSAVNLFEISNVAVTPADASLNITWDKLPANATAEIHELLPNGSSRFVTKSNSDCYLISGLTNGTTYHYQVRLVYVINGQSSPTRGLPASGTPERPEDPIDTLRVKPTDDGNFEAIWSQKDSADVRLFCATRKPKYNLGELIPMSALEQEMRPLQQRPLSPQSAKTLKANEKGASFQYSGAELLYIVAVVVKSGTAVFGSLARACKGENVNIKAIRPVNGKINITLDAPASATGFVVLYRFDRFPTDIGDVKTVRSYIPMKHYQLNGAIVLDTLEEKTYYFSVFAEFKRDGDKDYSSGTDYMFDNAPKANIAYSISVNKRLFGGSSLVLEFEADSRSFELPAIDVMSAVGNTPMFKASATLFHSIPAQHVNGSLTVSIPLPKGMPRDTYIKAFFQDEKAYSGSQLQIKRGSNYKIS